MKLNQLDIKQLKKLKEELDLFFKKRYKSGTLFSCKVNQFILYNRYHDELILRRNLFKLGTKKRFGDLENLWVGDGKEKYDLFLLEVIGTIFLSYGIDEVTFNYGEVSQKENQGVDYYYIYHTQKWRINKKY